MQSVQSVLFQEILPKLHITYVQKTVPEDPQDGSLWIDTNYDPPVVRRYNKQNDSWEHLQVLDTNLVASPKEPQTPYDGLLWLNTQTKQLMIYYDSKWNPIQQETKISYIQKDEPKDPNDGALWIDTNYNPPKVKRFNKESNTWEEVRLLERDVIASNDEPENPYESLLWYHPEDKKLYIYIDNTWIEIKTGGSSSTTPTIYKGDNKTIEVDNSTRTIRAIFNNDEQDKPGYLWDNKRIQKEALIKALIFG